MKKSLIKYIGDMHQVSYANVYDFFKDIQHNAPEVQVSILARVLLYIEEQEWEEKDTQ